MSLQCTRQVVFLQKLIKERNPILSDFIRKLDSTILFVCLFVFKHIKEFDEGFRKACPDTKYVIHKPLECTALSKESIM